MNKRVSTEIMSYPSGDKPNLSAFYVESGTRLDLVTSRKLLKHCVIVLRVVTGNVPDLELAAGECGAAASRIVSRDTHESSVLTLGTIRRRSQTLYSS